MGADEPITLVITVLPFVFWMIAALTQFEPGSNGFVVERIWKVAFGSPSSVKVNWPFV